MPAFSTLPAAARRLTGTIPASIIPGSRLLPSPGLRPPLIAGGFQPPPAPATVYQLKRSGNGRRAAAAKDSCSLGAMIRRLHGPAITTDGRPGRSRCASRSRTPTACLRCARTSTSGAATGLMRSIMQARRRRIHRGRSRGRGRCRGEVPGGTTSRYRDPPRAPASLPNFSTRTTAFASRSRYDFLACMMAIFVLPPLRAGSALTVIIQLSLFRWPELMTPPVPVWIIDALPSSLLL